MKRTLLLLASLAILLCSCQSKSSNAKDDQPAVSTSSVTVTSLDPQKIKALYKEVDSLTQQGKMDRQKMQKFVDEAVEYADKNPQDTISPHFLLYAGVMQMQVAFSNANEQQRTEQANQAITILERLLINHPDYRNIIYAYYYKAQIFENLGKTEKAATAYRELVNRFPDTELGKNIAAYLQNDGYEKSAEEIMQGFRR